MILQLLASRLIPHWFDKIEEEIVLFGTKAKPSLIQSIKYSWTCIDDRFFFFFLSIYFLSLSQCSSVPLHMNIIDITNTFFFFFYINSCDFKGTSLIRIPRGELLSPISFYIQEENVPAI